MPERKLIDQTQAHQLTSPNGTVYNVLVDNNGNFYTEKTVQGIGSQAVALWKASSYSGSGQFLNDLSGNGHHLKLGSTQPAYVAQGALHLPGVAGNYASTPDSTSNSVTGDIDIRVKAALTNWVSGSSQFLVAKYDGTVASTISYGFQVAASTGFLRLLLGDGTTVVSVMSSTAPIVTNGYDLWLRVTWRNSDNRVQFFTSYDGASWSQLGTDQSINLTSIHDSSQPIEIGSQAGGTANLANGRIFYAEVRNGIDGTMVAKFDPSAQADHTTNWYSETGEQWTINTTSGADTNEPKFLAKEANNYLYLPGTVGNYASVPYSSNLDISGDIDIRIKAALEDWTPASNQTLMAKDSGGSRNWEFMILTGGEIWFGWWDSGNTLRSTQSTVGVGLANGVTKYVRVTLDVNNGAGGNDARFWTSDDGITWTQLGSTVTQAFTTSILSGSASIEIGTYATGAQAPVAGKIYRAIIRNVVNDLAVLDVDFSKANPSSTTFTAETGQTVTVNRAASGRKSVVVDRALFLLGSDDYMEAPDRPDLDFATNQPYTVVSAVRHYNTGGTHVLFAKHNAGNAANPGVSAYIQTTGGGFKFRATQGDGANQGDRNVDASAQGILDVYVVKRDTTAGTFSVLRGSPANSSSQGDTLTGSSANDFPFTIGAYRSSPQTAPGTFAEYEFIGAAIFRKALSDEEIALLAGEFGV